MLVFLNRLNGTVIVRKRELWTLCFVQPLLTAQPEMGLFVTPSSSAAADFPCERPSVDNDVRDDSTGGASMLHSLQSDATLGVVFCLNAKRVDAQALLEAIANVCAPPMALLLQQQWLRRDRFKRVLQLELHRTVFQVSVAPRCISVGRVNASCRFTTAGLGYMQT